MIPTVLEGFDSDHRFQFFIFKLVLLTRTFFVLGIQIPVLLLLLLLIFVVAFFVK